MIDQSIFLRKYQASDFADYYQMVSDEAVMKYITEKALSEAEAREKFDSMLQINAKHERLGYFKVYDHKDTFIGDCKLEFYPLDTRCLEVGYILKEAFWGKGLATRLCAQMLALADEVAPEMAIIGIIDPANTASKRILQKFGFESYFVGMEDDLPTEKLRLAKA
ncbi:MULTISPECIES: GNAT family N-acetyltransferase [Sphingobacterium]|uniref:GNAT family N-acetyltransferase n=1 Tax=Sphingobacterium populi TaxID=1812824 RepID=A0ABW5UAK6_9SPHI|nr:GNAT family N-acetyltransferase [Sphingobacterium sp. CFCC 11742]